MQDFRRLVGFTLFVTYLVILAGAVVRGTGSGLGCPDWPRCFGQWIPPIDVSELPANYKELYTISGKEIADFDAFKTWTEYVNRLLGAFLGFLILVTFVKSFKHSEQEPNLPWFCGGILFLVIIQGGLGAVVVSSHLKPFIITLHMMLALLLMFSLHYLRKYSFDLMNFGLNFVADKKNLFHTKILILLTSLQVMMGTQVREQVDSLMRDQKTATADTVVDQLGWMFYVHRSFSLFLVVYCIWNLVRLYRFDETGGAFRRNLLFLLLVLINVASGIGLNYFGFPAQMQPPHLFVAVLAMGVLFEQYLNQKGSLIS
jgi:cytochrome c oxidase assembly protein subunit 15